MSDDLDKIIRESLAIEAQEAQEAGAVGFMARALTQATMPHRKSPNPVFSRKNGSFSLAMLAHPDIGLPYGSIPRLLLSWMTTEAVRTKSPLLGCFCTTPRKGAFQPSYREIIRERRLGGLGLRSATPWFH